MEPTMITVLLIAVVAIIVLSVFFQLFPGHALDLSYCIRCPC